MSPMSLSFSGRIYRLLLFAYPAAFRREYGWSMAQLFRDEARQAVGNNGIAGLAALWFLTLIDLIKSALAEHIWEIFHMPLSKLERWSGLAAAMGGPLFIATWTSHTFWRVVMATGVPEGDYLHPLLAEIGLLLIAVGAFSLYRRLPARTVWANKSALALSLIGTLAEMVTTLGLVISLPSSAESLLAFGYLGINLGIAVMGIIAIADKSLGFFSFAPLLATITIAGFVFTIESSEQVAMLFVAVHNICWVLLGIGLWLTTEEMPNPALPA